MAAANDVDQRHSVLVLALAVDQHQGLVRPEAAQCGTVDQVGAVGTGLAGRIERHRELKARSNNRRWLVIAANAD